jgi:glutamate dehydrogenase/leucine dehydrogenase
VPAIRLRSVDALVVFDLDDARHSAGGTRLASDVSERECALLARAMTYKFAVLGSRLGGAKGVVRAIAADREDAMARYCEEIRSLVESGRFITGPDLGTYEADFAPLRGPGWEGHVITSTVDGVAFEDVLTGYGIAVAAEAALDGLDVRRVAIEGFGKVGAGVAREVDRRGGRVVAVSTIVGCLVDERGLDVERLLEWKFAHGDALVQHAGVPSRPREALFDIECDVLVPGARTGVLDEGRAARVAATAVVPAANVPYTASGLRVLHERGIAAHADFVCNAAAVVGYSSSPGAGAQEVLDQVEQTIHDLVADTRDDPAGPFAAACARAEAFLRTWCTPGGSAPGPPLA